MLVASVCLAVVVAGCGPAATDKAADGRLRVQVSVPPQAWLVERIGGEHVTVGVLARAGQDPHSFEPTPRQIMDLNASRLYFKVGVEFERVVLSKVQQTSTGILVVDMTKGLTLRTMGPHHHDGAEDHDEDHDDHDEHADHDDHADHDHDADHVEPAVLFPDPHVWLSPIMLQGMADNTLAALSATDPAHAAEYKANREALRQELDALHAELQAVLAPAKGQSVFVFHPAFGYFTDAYGLKQVAVETYGRSPSAKQLEAVIDAARASGAHVIFVQPQFNPASAEVVAKAIGGRVLPLNDLDRDVPVNLRAMAAAVAAAVPGGNAGQAAAVAPPTHDDHDDHAGHSHH